MTVLARSYKSIVFEALERIAADGGGTFARATAIVEQSLRDDRLVHVTGSGHSHMVAEEVFYRAGGLAAVQAVLDPPLMLHEGARRSSDIERQEGRADELLHRYRVAKDDVVIIVSNSGRNAFPVDMATAARALGARTIAITSFDTASKVGSRHSSGKLLRDCAEIAIDNCVPVGDATLQIPGTPHMMGPISSITGMFILNLLMAEAVAALAAKGMSVDVYRSANGLPGGEDAAAVAARWDKRIIGL